MIVLTKKQEAFALAYVQHPDLNASDAYRAAYGVARMTAKTINEAASRLLANSKVAARIAELRAPALAKHGLTVERTLMEVARLAYSDPRQFFQSDGTLKPIEEWTTDMAAAVASLEIDETKVGDLVVGHTKKLKFWDKNAAIEKAMKHLGLYEKDNSQVRPNLALQVVLVDGPAAAAAPIVRKGPVIEVSTR